MPFSSRSQMRKCFATHGFRGKVNCREWAHETKNMKSLPNKAQTGRYMTENPVTPITTGAIKEAEDIHGVNYEQVDEPNGSGILPLLQTASVGASWLSGIMERNRQKQYMQQQYGMLGQMNPVPYQNYQPNPYSLYAKYGGSLRKHMKQAGGLALDIPTPQAQMYQPQEPLPWRMGKASGLDELFNSLFNTPKPQRRLRRFGAGAMGKEGGTILPVLRKGGNWIPKKLHKGRCTPAPNPDCPVGSPQYNLAMTFKKHHGFHKKKK